MNPPFVILALARSRTKWLSGFLSYPPWHCGHDEVRHCRSLEDARSWFVQPLTGTAETGAAAFWRLLPPGVRVVTVRRPVEQCLASLMAAGLPFEIATIRHALQYEDRKLDQLERRLPGVRRFEFADLAQEETCAALFGHCLGLPHDHDWWAAHAQLHVAGNIGATMRYIIAHQPQLEKIRRIAKHEMLRRLRRPIEMDGIVFAQEPLAQAFSDRDGMRLMSDECVGLGDYPEAFEHMNIQMLARIEAMGNLHIYTARSNGRMFGYLVTAIGEAFHARDQLEADQVSFYADPTWPGLGRKLQHAAIEDLRQRGVDRVLMFQPDSTRVGLVYRRLGARQTGQRYVLELQ